MTGPAHGILAGRRLVYVVPALDMGGSERQALVTGGFLSQNCGMRVCVMGTGGASLFTRLCEEQGVEWRSMGLGWHQTGRGDLLRRLVRFAADLRSAKPDVIMTWVQVGHVFSGLMWRFTGARATVWNQRNAGLQRRSPRLERVAVRQTPWFATNSSAGVAFLCGELGVPRSSLALIANAYAHVSPAASATEWRARLGVGARDFVACMVANLHGQKDHPTLLRAWKLVVDQWSDSTSRPVLALAGWLGATTLALKAQAFDLGLCPHVRFLGQVDDIAGLLAACDCGVHSSVSEGLPNGVIECMAAGLAVVGSNIPGIREAVGTGGERLLAAPADPVALAERVLHLARRPDVRAEAGRVNKERVLVRHDPRERCQEYAVLLRRVVGIGRSREN